jgi:hypothetical protein
VSTDAGEPEPAPSRISPDIEFIGGGISAVDKSVWDVADSIRLLAAALVYASGRVKRWEDAKDMMQGSVFDSLIPR